MATQNLTGNGQQKAVGDLTCSSYLLPGPEGHLTFISVINTFMSVTAFLGNALILISLHKESSLHPPFKLLLRSLATTDLFVGLISQPLFAIFCISIANEYSNMFRYASSTPFATASIFCGVSVFTVTTT